MPGKFIVKASQHSLLEGQVVHISLAPLPDAKTQGLLTLLYTYKDLSPVVGAPYRVEFEDGTAIEGKLDQNGKAEIQNPPGAGKVYYGYDARDAFPYPKPPENPLFGFVPTTEQEAAEALQRYAQAEADYLEDNYFPDEIDAIYSGETDYIDYTGQYQYAQEQYPEAHEEDEPEPGAADHLEVWLTDDKSPSEAEG